MSETIAIATASLARVRSAALAALEALDTEDHDAAYAATLAVQSHAADAKAALAPVVRLQTWLEAATEEWESGIAQYQAEGR